MRTNMDALLEPAIINSKKRQRQRSIIFFNKDIKYLEKKYNHRCNWDLYIIVSLQSII
jgi:hypothetical protein